MFGIQWGNPINQGVKYDLQLALCAFGYPPAEDIHNVLRCDSGQAKIARAFKDRVNRTIASENNVLGVFHLVEEVIPAQINSFSFMAGELRPQLERSIVQPFLNGICINAVGAGQQSTGVGYGNEGIVLHTETHSIICEHFGNDIMTVEIIRCAERQKSLKRIFKPYGTSIRRKKL